MESSHCASCATAVPSSAAFCPSCGSRTGAPAGPLLNPEAERAIRAATDSAKAAVANLGLEKTLGIAGGLLGIVGVTALPFYSTPISLFGVDLGSVSFIHVGVSADLMLILAIILGVAPLLLNLSRAAALAGFGLGCAALGAMLLAFTGLPYGSSVTLGTGYYCTVIGFALLTYVYGRGTR